MFLKYDCAEVVSLCLDEVSASDVVVGYFGSRYGSSTHIPDNKRKNGGLHWIE